MQRPSRQERRGVLLLVVLSLLVIFLLAGLSFLVSASKFNRRSKSLSRARQGNLSSGKPLAHQVLLQVLRGTSNPHSAIRDHSLLEDLYGRDFLIGKAVAVEDFQQSGEQILALQINDGFAEMSNSTEQLRDDYFGGCVLTMLSGEASGHSVRVLRYRPSERRILIDGTSGVELSLLSSSLVQGNIRFLINGRPFNGTGAGYDASSGSLLAGREDSAVPTAYLPNRLQRQELQRSRYSAGGLDESWDAVDYQNVFLAKGTDRALINAAVSIPSPSDLSSKQRSLVQRTLTTGGVTPSFHRPYLISHLLSNGFSPDLALLRPTSGQHPSFTGSNLQFDPVNGPWDVDNDGDGINDSVWIDAGLAVVRGEDGRLYKPLAAIHCVDLDGRPNVNAVDSLERVKLFAELSQLPTPQFRTQFSVIPGVTGVAISLEQDDKRALGLGFGTADINSNQPAFAIRRRYAGQYRQNGVAKERRQTSLSNTLEPWAEVAAPGLPATNDAGVQPGLRFKQSNSLMTGFGSPLDLHGRALPFIDPLGNLTWAGPYLGEVEGVDDPYELCLNHSSALDRPFEISDLGGPRHLGFAPRSATNMLANKSPMEPITTRSFSIPVPPCINFGRFRGEAANDGNGEGLARSVRGMFARKIRRLTGVSLHEAHQLAEPLLAPEFARGEKINLNRALQAHPANFGGAASAAFTAQQVQQSIHKERFARHLLYLMLMLTDHDVVTAPQSGVSLEARREQYVQRVAQWAVNVVDFGDADSVMTRLRYDVNPFDLRPIRFDEFGRIMANSPEEAQAAESDLREVWGMEHPELRITETLGMHDRRASDDALGTKLAEEDEDLDSIYRPQGSAFIELYCPRSPQPRNAQLLRHQMVSRCPEDLYEPISVNAPEDQTLNLAKRAGDSPVWRISIGEATSRTRRGEPVPLSSGEPTDDGTSLHRFIWFTDVGPPPLGTLSQERSANTFYRDMESSGARVRPGQYVVIGPRLSTPVGKLLSGKDSPQQIRLNTSHRRADGFPLRALPDRPHVEIPNRLGVVSIVARSANGQGFNVSEPIGGYRDSLPSDVPLDNIAPGDGLEADSPLYEPADQPNDQRQYLQATRSNSNFGTVFLQRLANPNLPFQSNRDEPNYNPYRTVDTMPMPLTVFNSLHQGHADPAEENTPVDAIDIASLERTQTADAYSSGFYNIWSDQFRFAPRTTHDRLPGKALDLAEGAANMTNTVNTNVVHSLGWLNRSFDTVGEPDGMGHFRREDRFVGTTESPRAIPDPRNDNVPSSVPSLVWNNRPYANEYELLLVPATSSPQLSAQYSSARRKIAADYEGQFGHLLNLFHSSLGIPNEGAAAANLFRIFDFVHVPSRFRGTRKRFNRNVMSESNPFARELSYISHFREPGRININTASVQTLSLLGFDSNLKTHAANRSDIQFANSLAGYRQGISLPGAPHVIGRLPDGAEPAEYPNPLRASASADLLAQLGRIERRPYLSIDATLLRTDTASTRQPLLSKYEIDLQPENVAAYALQNRRTNAYFFYRDLIKLGGTVTSQSNVFAIWVTVGYFEVEPNYGTNGEAYLVDLTHPDGYRWGAEKGSELGQVVRHQSFYVVDRSIPVAFEPGVNHNVENSIIYQRRMR